MPDIDGVALCRRLRAVAPDGVIVVLSARTGELDVVVALDAGADDYLMKPFRLTELLARLRAHLRRRLEPGGSFRAAFPQAAAYGRRQPPRSARPIRRSGRSLLTSGRCQRAPLAQLAEQRTLNELVAQ